MPPATFAGVALLLAALWVLAGRRVLVGMLGSEVGVGPAWAVGAALGFGVGGTLVAWLGVLGALRPVPIGMVCLGWAAVGLAPLPGTRPSGGFERPSWALVLGGLAVLVIGAASLVHACVPPWQPDSLYYQLTLPRMYLEHGGFVKLAQEPVVSGYPALGQMLFALALVVGHDELAAVASWLHWLLLVVATYLLVAHVARDGNAAPAGWVAAIVMGAVPIGAVVGSAALVDTITAAQLTVACLAALKGWERGERAWTVVCALCLGFALGNKYLALPGALLIAGAVVAGAARRGAREALIHATIGVVVVAGVWAPWAIKNQRDWGSALFPLHCPTGTPDRVRALLAEHRDGFLRNGQATPFWRLPLDVTFAADPDDIGRFQGEVGPLLLALAALPLVAGRPRGAAGALGAYGLLLCVIWALASRQVRFLLPALPPLLAAVLARGRWPRALGIVVALGAWGCAGWTVNHLRPGYDLGFVAGRETRESYYRTLSATAGLFEAFAALRSEPPGAVALFWEYRGYLCPRPFWPEHAYRLQGWPREPERLVAELRRIGVSHVLVNRSIAEEETARGVKFELQQALEGLGQVAGVRRVPLRETASPKIELWRLK